jgi:hypothetical protein
LASLTIAAGLILGVLAATGDGSSNDVDTVDYDLSARLRPEDKSVEGQGQIRWSNKTDTPVRELWWHLYLNAFRNDHSTMMIESSGGKLRSETFERGKWGSIDVTRLSLDGVDLLGARTFEHPDDDNTEDRTVMRTPLPREVAPGESIDLQIAFLSKLPKVFARSGYAGDFFMVAQWFPKIGVLESRGKWNCHQYHATSEFFSDYGRYKVAITVPKRFVVGATGRRIETKEGDDGSITYLHQQDRVHDFAWTADPRFLRKERDFVFKERVTPEELKEASSLLGVPPEDLALSDVKLILLLQPEHAMFEERYFTAVQNAIKWFGLWYGAYPYETLTIVDGPRTAMGAMGMEYPTLITGGSRWPPSELPSPEGVTVHEFGHQYWYGLVGSNEFEESWLDEGFNTYSTGKVLDRAYGSWVYAPSLLGVPLVPWFESEKLTQIDVALLGTLISPTSDAIVRRAWEFRDALSYGVNSYSRTGLVLRQLEVELGPEVFARAMRAYHLAYRYKHPRTEDFIATVERVSGKDLGELFGRLIHSPGAIDYAIDELWSARLAPAEGVGDDGKLLPWRAEKTPLFRTDVYVERLEEVAHPVTTEIRFEDGSSHVEAWDGEYRWKRITMTGPSRAVSARLNPNKPLLVDLDRADDSRTIDGDLRPGASWGAHALYLLETMFQLIGSIL